MGIILPDYKYHDALKTANSETLYESHDSLSLNLLNEISHTNDDKLASLLPPRSRCRKLRNNRTFDWKIGNSLYDWKSPRGVIPQGTKLGVILFAVMTNNLLHGSHLSIKFVDDTTTLQILPRNGISLLNVAVTDIHKFSVEHNMKLNPKKCKEM